MSQSFEELPEEVRRDMAKVTESVSGVLRRLSSLDLDGLDFDSLVEVHEWVTGLTVGLGELDARLRKLLAGD